MNEQFTLSHDGVSEWLTFIYAGGAVRVDQECASISADFVGWLSQRFALTADQISFVVFLGPLVQDSYSASIRNVLQQGGSISLEKPATRLATDPPAQNPKVIYKDQQDIVSEDPDPESNATSAANWIRSSALVFRIVYLTN